MYNIDRVCQQQCLDSYILKAVYITLYLYVCCNILMYSFSKEVYQVALSVRLDCVEAVKPISGISHYSDRPLQTLFTYCQHGPRILLM